MGQALDYSQANATTPPTAFETSFDVGDTVKYFGQDAVVTQVIVGPERAIRLTVSGPGLDATVDAARVTRK